MEKIKAGIPGVQKGGDIVAPLAALLLDSSLISPTKPKKSYNIKMVYCGDFIQVYKLKQKRLKDVTKDYEKSDFYELNLRKYTNNNHDKDYIKFQSINEKIFRLICFSKEFWNIIQLKKYKLLNFPINITLKIIITTKKCDKKNKSIDLKNVIRSKLLCQRLAKCNFKKWRTFITLTIAKNIKDINIANKQFRYFIDKIRRTFKDFTYLCIPEFQKRGAIHYHLLTNIDYDNDFLINENIAMKKLFTKFGKDVDLTPYKEENIKLKQNEKMNDRDIVLRYQYGKYHNTKKLWIRKKHDFAIFKTIKYWNCGHSRIDMIQGDIKKIIGYIAKYMTKDIDNRLFGKHRFFYSQNLLKPETLYFDTSDLKDDIYFNSYLLDKKIIYENTYINSYDNEEIAFTEYLKNN